MQDISIPYHVHTFVIRAPMLKPKSYKILQNIKALCRTNVPIPLFLDFSKYPRLSIKKQYKRDSELKKKMLLEVLLIWHNEALKEEHVCLNAWIQIYEPLLGHLGQPCRKKVWNNQKYACSSHGMRICHHFPKLANYQVLYLHTSLCSPSQQACYSVVAVIDHELLQLCLPMP